MGSSPSVTETDPACRGRIPVIEEPGLPPLDAEAYEILGEIARGGMGQILRARDRRLDRPVAIKQLLVRSPKNEALFAREIRLTARLQHPSIVTIYEAGTLPSGELAYAMKLIPGRPLRDVLREEVASGSETGAAARLAHLPAIIAIADALAYAHGAGVVHRDLKPSNVIVGEFGEVVVIDWGLATDVHADSHAPDLDDLANSPAATAAAMGTPAYMAPEAARGEPVDKRADVYALGAILYEALTGGPPYTGESGAEVLRAVQSGAPVAIADRGTGIPIDLVAIVDKAMARDPDDRYPTARELADELRRFQTGQLVSAHAYTRKERFGRWLRRNRTPVAIAVTALCVVLVLVWLGVRRIVQERDLADERADGLALARARLELDRDPAAAVRTLEDLRDGSREWTAARILVADARARGIARQLARGHVLGSTVDGTRIVTRDRGRVIVLDATGSELSAWSVGATAAIAVARDASAIAAIEAGVLRVWTADGTLRLERPAPRVGPRLAIAPDGSAVAVAGRDLGVRAWRIAGGDELLHDDARAELAAIAIAPGGTLALASRGAIVVHRPDAAERAIEVTGSPSLVAVAPDGAVVASAIGDAVRIDTPHRDPVWLDTDGTPSAIALTGAALVVASERSVGEWTLDGHRIRTLRGARGTIDVLAVDEDGTRIVAGGDSGAWTWTVGDAERVADGDPHTMTFTTSGTMAVGATADGVVRVWDLAHHTSRRLGTHAAAVRAIAISGDRRTAVTGGDDRTLRRWSLIDGAPAILGTHLAAVTAVAIDRDGTTVISGGADRMVRLWSTTGHNRVLGAHAGPVIAIAITPDGRHAISAADDPDVVVWDLGSGAARRLPHDSRVSALAIAPAGDRIVVGTRAGDVVSWPLPVGDTIAGTVIAHHEGPVRDLAFSPDGRRVASASDDGTAIVIALDRGDDRVVLRGHRDFVRRIAFSPDGNAVVTVGEDQTVRLWDPYTGEGRSLRVGAPIADAAFASRDVVIAAGEHGALWSWRDDLPRDPEKLRDAIATLIGTRDKSGSQPH